MGVWPVTRSQTQKNIRRGKFTPYRINQTDTRDPRAAGQCDGCGRITYWHMLSKNMEYRGGAAPVWDGTLRCDQCIDVPQPYFQRQVLRSDPVPVVNPRPESATGDTSDTYPTYASGSLPDPATYYAGSQIDVTGGSLPGRAYSDTINWRNVESGEVVT